MSLYDEHKARALRDGIIKTIFYICLEPQCREITESADYIDKCPSCGWQGELTEASTLERAQTIQKISLSQITGLETAKQETKERDNKAQIASRLADNIGFLAAAKALYKEIPFLYDKRKLWFLYNTTRSIYELVDETDILIIIRKALELISDSSIKRKQNLIEALRQVGREHNVPDLPLEYIQFKDQLYNIKTKTITQAGPEYLSTNTIPWTIGTTKDTPVIDQLFTQWVGEEQKIILYEILAYCTYRDYPLHLIFVLNGSGRNGKSKFLGIIERFIGKENITSTSLDRLTDNRFETFNLWRKNVAMMGETNFNVLQNTSLIKQLSGQDLITYEAKGVTGFSGYNYAKLIISTNSLPSTDDTSEGFYRRWMIVDFPNEFPEGKDILSSIPPQEYEALARRSIELLPLLLEREHFTQQGSIAQRKQKYIAASNPLTLFFTEACVEETDANIPYSKLYVAYVQWLKDHKKRIVKPREFSRALEDHGLEKRSTSIIDPLGMRINGMMIFGVRLKFDLRDFVKVNEVNEVNGVSLHPYAYTLDGVEPRSLGSHGSLFAKITDYVSKNSGCTTDQIPGDIISNREVLTKLAKLGEIFELPTDHWRIRIP